jgi:hypothetical protein
MLEIGLIGMVMQAFITAILGYLGWLQISPPQQLTAGSLLLATALLVAFLRKRKRN